MRTFGACGEGASAPRAPPLVTGLTLLLWLLTTWERFVNQILQCLVDTFHETRSYVTERHGSE